MFSHSSFVMMGRSTPQKPVGPRPRLGLAPPDHGWPCLPARTGMAGRASEGRLWAGAACRPSRSMAMSKSPPTLVVGVDPDGSHRVAGASRLKLRRAQKDLHVTPAGDSPRSVLP